MDDPIPPDDDMEDEVLELETVDILLEVETMKVPDMLAASIVELFCFVSCGFGSGQKLTVSCGLRSRPIYTFFVFFFRRGEENLCKRHTLTHKTYV